MDIEQALEGYLAQVQPSPHLTKAFQDSWPKFVSFCRSQGLTRLQEIAPCHIEEFHSGLLWNPLPDGRLYRPNTLDQFLRRVRQLLRWAHSAGHTSQEATQNLLLPRPQQPTRSLLRWEELQALLDTFDLSSPGGLRDAAIFAVVTETDLGLIGTLGLVVGQEELLELEEPTRNLVRTYLQQGRLSFLKDPREKTLFLGRGGSPLGRQAATIRLQLAAKIAGLQVTTVVLRRSYKAHLARQAQNRHFSFNRNL